MKKVILLFILLTINYLDGKAQFKETYFEKGKRAIAAGDYALALENFNYSLDDRSYFQAYFFRGYAKYNLGDLIGAEADYTACLKEIPNHQDALFYRAIVRDQLSNFEGAFKDYERALHADSLNSKIYLSRAITLLSLEKFEATIADCNQAIRLKKGDAASYVIRGIAKTELEQFESALSDFNFAINHKTDNSFAMVYRAECYRKMERFEEARADLKTVLQRDSNNVDGLYQLAILELEENQLEKALKLLDKVLKLSPYNTLALFNRAITKTKQKDLKGALVDYDAVIVSNPKHISSYFNRALLKQELGDLKGALADFNQLIEIQPNYVDAYGARAQLKRQMKDLKGAADDQQLAAQVRANNIAALDEGLSSEEVQEAMETIKLSSDGSAVAENSEKLQYQYAEARLRPYYYLTPVLSTKVAEDYYQPSELAINSQLIGLMSEDGDWDMEQLKQQLDSLNKQKSDKSAAFYLNRAIVYTQMEWYNQAFLDYDSTLTLDPNNVLAYFGRANTSLKLRELLHTFPNVQEFKKEGDKITSNRIEEEYLDYNYTNIISDFKKAVSLDPQFSYAYYNMSFVQNKNEEYNASLESLHKAIALKPNFGQAYFNRGLTYLYLKRTDQGCTDLGKAGELGIKEAYNIILRYCKK
ncbi:tetratricopeptide repeat protein [bacterium]|nr:tetratricopeptide repeat protein [bacterium]